MDAQTKMAGFNPRTDVRFIHWFWNRRSHPRRQCPDRDATDAVRM